MPAATSMPVLEAEFETNNTCCKSELRIKESTSRLELFMAKVPPMPTLVLELSSFTECLVVVPPRVIEPRKSVAERETTATGEVFASVPSVSLFVSFFTVTLSKMASVLPPKKVRATLPSIPMEAPAGPFWVPHVLEESESPSESAEGAGSPSGLAAEPASRPAPDALFVWVVSPTVGAALSFWEVTLSCSRFSVLVLASLAPVVP